MVLNGNGAVSAPSKTNLPERHPDPAQQECNSLWEWLLELNPKPLVSKAQAVYPACPADSDSGRLQPLVGPVGTGEEGLETGLVRLIQAACKDAEMPASSSCGKG